jgi:hypothetical protein
VFFLDTKKKLAGCGHFLLGLDQMLASKSKPWYMKAIRKMTLASHNVAEMESCTKYLSDGCRYWPMAASRNEAGEVNDDTKGKEYPEDQVELRLGGQWHRVDWILLLHKLEAWTNKIQPDADDHLGGFTTLCMVKQLMSKTMKLLKLAKDGESKMMTHLPALDSWTRSLSLSGEAILYLKGVQLGVMQNVVDALNAGLKEFGSRWAKQWENPTNYNAPLTTTFADKNCFVYRTLDRLDKVAVVLNDFHEVLPSLFEGGNFSTSPMHTELQMPLQRANQKSGRHPLTAASLVPDAEARVPSGEALPLPVGRA